MPMNTEGEQVAHIENAAVWADEKLEAAPKKTKLPGVNLLVAMTTLATLLAVGGSICTYVNGSQAARVMAAQAGENAGGETAAQMAEQARQWALQMELTAVSGGVGIFG